MLLEHLRGDLCVVLVLLPVGGRHGRHEAIDIGHVGFSYRYMELIRLGRIR